jgi:FkbM family methyltransferase
MDSLRPFPSNWQVLVTKIKTSNPFWLASYYKVGTEDIDVNTQEILRHGVWEPTITSAFVQILEEACKKDPNAVVVDVGANIGYFSLLSASMGCKVHAWEPLPENLKLVQMGLNMNPSLAKRIILHPNICTEEKTPLEISGTNVDGHVKGSYEHDDMGAARKKEMTGFRETGGIRVEGLSIDEAVGGENIVLLKVDVEGYEPHVMQSAKSVLKRKQVGTIILEYNMWRGMTAAQGIIMLEQLRDFGYELSVAMSPTCDDYIIKTREDFQILSQTLKDNTNKCYQYAAMILGRRK